MKISWFFVILLLGAVAIFSVQNAEVITVHFIVWKVEMSAALVIQMAALLGALVGLIVGVFSRRRRRVEKALPAPPPGPVAPQNESGADVTG